MRRYMEVSAEIYHEHLRYVSAEDAWPHSADESFFDATPYLSLYGLDARAFAKRLITSGPSLVSRASGASGTASRGGSPGAASTASPACAPSGRRSYARCSGRTARC